MCIIFLQRADTSVCKRRRDSDGSKDGQPFLRDKYYLLHFDFHHLLPFWRRIPSTYICNHLFQKPPEYSPLDYPPQNIIKILTFL